MSDGQKKGGWGLVILGVLGVFAFITWMSWPDPGSNKANIVIPTLTAEGEQGRIVYKANCAACHGDFGGGATIGPPLVHIFYEPSHHNDGSFVNAIRSGAKAHHWMFGDMPPRPDVAAEDIPKVIAFVREVQRANGIK